MKRTHLATTSSRAFTFVTAALLGLCAAPGARAQFFCPETNLVKFLTLPQTNGGSDIQASRGILVADDFRCTARGPITDIHLWGSWTNDIIGTITNFWLGIYSDVPAVTNLSGQVVSNSHPGAILWSNNFNSAQFCLSNYASSLECFFNPSNNGSGFDSTIWYYSFFPPNPFIQQGTTANPTNYWLAVYAEVAETNRFFGWKTSWSNYNDSAVWIPAGANGMPVSGASWTTISNLSCYGTNYSRVNLSFKLNGANTPAPICEETNGVKYLQWPNTNSYPWGWDVWNSSTRPSGVTDGPWVLADDFVCTNTGPITDIHLWGSWWYDLSAPNTITFWLGLYSDVPAGTNFSTGIVTNSHPGNLLAQQTFSPGQYAEGLWCSGVSEFFLDPTTNAVGSQIGADSQVWYYCFYPTNFSQSGTISNATIYWLAAYAQLPAGLTNVFGWKTTTNVQHDVSVHEVWLGSLPGLNTNWLKTVAPMTPTPLAEDLAFKINTGTNVVASPPCCPDTGGVKYLQNPRLTNGVDVLATYSPPNPFWGLPWIVADDFPCTNSGPVTDIHLWGSWQSDQVDYAAAFTLAIWSDVPTNAANPNYSHPGQLLWTQTFTNGQYTICPYTNKFENFNDAYCDVIGSSTNLFYLCFNADPANTFHQTGTPTAKTNYWLSVTVQAAPNSYFGWKSSSDAYNDASVSANTSLYPAPTDWSPNCDPQGGRLNLAFKLTTATNPCPALSLFCSNATIQCGEAFPTNPPIYIDPCCTNVQVFSLGSLTNNTGCGKTIFQTWEAYDYCYNVSAICTQTVTVLPSIPSLLCSNLLLSCGDFSYTDAPLYVDLCCTNVQVTLSSLTGITNGCSPFFTQTWRAVDLCCFTTNFCTRTVSIQPSIAGLQCGILSLNCGDHSYTNPPPFFDPCCTNVQVTLASLTGITNGCSQAFTQTWKAVDLCCFTTNFCTRLVTVLPTTPPTLTCAPDKSIACTAALTFDPPAVFDNCCPSNSLTYYFLGSNLVSAAQCQAVWKGWWQVSDCCTNFSAICTQTVTVVASTAPSITCAPNKTVQCGTPWTFDQPASVAASCGAETLDQQQPAAPNVAGGPDQWQSFTAARSGLLTRIDLDTGSPTSPSPSSGTIRIYSGEGTSGTLLDTESVTFSDPLQFHTFALATPPVVTAGNQYTIRFGVPTASVGWVALSTANPYAGGRASADPSWDYTFKTYVTPAPTGCGTNLSYILASSNLVAASPCTNVWNGAWQVRDCCSNLSAVCTQVVTVVDTTPPTFLSCPANMVLTSCNLTNPITWTIAATDSCSSVTIVSTPPSGTAFHLGTTNVIVAVAKDACGNTNTCTFTIAIIRPPLGEPRISYTNHIITITWSGGVLEGADEVLGPYTDITSVSPYSVAANLARRFYRVRCSLSPPESSMILIPAGSYNRGNYVASQGAGDPEITDAPTNSVLVSAFYIESTLVTGDEWNFVKGGYANSHGYLFDNPGSSKATMHPVQTINWFDALKWCNTRSEMEGATPVYYADAGFTTVYKAGQLAPYIKPGASGYRLPTEAEWEKAARGGLSGKRFPWGDTIKNGPPGSGGQANYYGNTSYSYDLGPNSYNTAYNDGVLPYTSPVASFPANGYSLYDMVGNVYEWCWDWYSPTYYAAGQTDPQGPGSGSNRVFRGGACDSYSYYGRCAYRDNFPPTAAANTIGFRCVRSAF